MNRAIKSKLRHLPARTLVLSYLLTIMTMSIIFSVVFFLTTNHDTATEAQTLFVNLLLLNLATLVVGAGVSYWLARKTLRPIEKALDKQDQYIANASHEFRTPLASALLSNEIALKNSGLTLLQAKAIIEGNVKDMQELKLLSDEVLRESENKSSVLKLTKVDTHKAVRGTIQKLIVIASEKNTTINNNTTSLTVVTDADVLRKVLVILIENAIKYSPADATVTITNRDNKSDVDIIVTDQGIGIDPDDLANIFTRFYRTDQSRSYTTGYGLGLSIAKTLLDKIGAHMTVKSVLGEGSEFTITLPAETDEFVSRTRDEMQTLN